MKLFIKILITFAFGAMFQTPLVYASCQSSLSKGIKTNSREVVEAAFNCGANVNGKDEEGFPMLHWAILEKHNEIALVLLNKGANLEIRNSAKATSLHVASVINNPVLAEEPIRRGADIAATNIEGWRALHFTVAREAAHEIKKPSQLNHPSSGADQ
ncbi:MAG: hypothetical protein O9274_01485 [Limnobacter sp.]|uniref:ankyrin repeat domain-containing protein n=1 Tax=Limnobacter sp. TaxID=2003368 RepID=UPI0022BB4A2F|nr:ankyrin repeat domain-containing protein [Limnobacter sp.]MCZ8014344.1 hypothetical protein [Limnobacter sp.]